jgi:cytochrome c5
MSASTKLAEALARPTSQDPLIAEEAEPTEARVPKSAVSPEDPTAAEVEAHRLSGHACFRSWCRHCIRGKGTEAPHSRGKPPDLPELQ